MGVQEIEVIIDEEGIITLNQIGFEGQKCSGAVDDLVRQLGNKTHVQRKAEYDQTQHVNVNATNQ